MEELRAVMVDRFVLKLINLKIMTALDIVQKPNGACLLKEQARKKLITQWQNGKQIEITHPYLKEKMKWGLVPFLQAQLLARYLRGDLDEYPPFFWK